MRRGTWWEGLPEEALSPPETLVLLTVVAEYQEHSRATVRSVAARAGYGSPGHTISVLRRLREQGLVTWEPGLAATLRPLVTVVPSV